MYEKKFDIQGHLAHTLSAEAVRGPDSNQEVGSSSYTHESGWTISGRLYEDYFVWVNEFEATHPFFGRVWGDFEDVVYADSEEGYADFVKNHPPEEWDYWDI